MALVNASLDSVMYFCKEILWSLQLSSAYSLGMTTSKPPAFLLSAVRLVKRRTRPSPTRRSLTRWLRFANSCEQYSALYFSGTG